MHCLCDLLFPDLLQRDSALLELWSLMPIVALIDCCSVCCRELQVSLISRDGAWLELWCLMHAVCLLDCSVCLLQRVPVQLDLRKQAGSHGSHPAAASQRCNCHCAARIWRPAHCRHHRPHSTSLQGLSAQDVCSSHVHQTLHRELLRAGRAWP